ncbi:Ribonucleoprotein PTB-binding 2 [Varanus komodoensis]|nr:Ribonucleoprotein PTB-binding 2 [Varanus komodoensis]
MAAAAGSSVALMGTLGKSPMGMGGTLRPLAPEEIACRLRNTRRELSNRRKILLRNLPLKSSSQVSVIDHPMYFPLEQKWRSCGPPDVELQLASSILQHWEIHDLLKGFELKYCYVDKNKRTAFFTLLNGEQAQNVIRLFHQHSLQGKDLSVQLQPTDALLCITNLPTSCTLQEFEHLVQPYGNVERHFLIYGEITGYSKGYGFVEYMKRDSAAKARLDHLGKQLRGNILLAQWMDVNLLTPELIHSKCLCVENLPTNCIDAEDLMQTFSTNHKSVFYQVPNMAFVPVEMLQPIRITLDLVSSADLISIL